MNIIEKMFGTHSDRELKMIRPKVDKILALHDTMAAMSDEELKAQTGKFKERLQNGETLDDLLPEAYATVRGFEESARHGAFPGTAHRWCGTPSGTYRRDENR